MLNVLGIESSCDDTAAAVVRGAADAPPGTILSNVVLGQDDLHAIYGGVVPEIAARAHAERLDAAVTRALDEAGAALPEMDAVAVTAGPGLIGGLIAGVSAAKGVALGAGLPLVGVNHLAGHALTARLTDGLAYPYLLLLVSGGHCQLLAVEGPESYRRLGTTLDDAPGEAFDKAAKLMGLGVPGGPAVERCAAAGDADRFALPRPLARHAGCDFSFSGLKTAVRMTWEGLASPGERDRADLCAGFQRAVARHLAERAGRAMARFAAAHGPGPLAVAGGVAANAAVRAALEAEARAHGFTMVAPPLRLCTDNAAMIAWAGLEALAAGRRDGLDLAPRPRWPLDANAAPKVGFGKRGAKA